MQARLSRNKLFAVQVVVGALVLIGAGGLFGAIVANVVSHDAFLFGVDLHVANWLHAHATPTLTSVMLFVSYFGAPVTVIVIGAVAALTLLWHRRRYALLALVVALPGGMLGNVLMKNLVQRQRPSFDDPLLTLTSYSFPSGHALGATLLYGVLAAVMVWTATNRRWRLTAIVVASIMIALISFSRIYLGVHYLSDVVAGMLSGVVWVILCLLGVAAYRRYRSKADTAMTGPR
jgi:membrane-associated phospholipid phosphatase